MAARLVAQLGGAATDREEAYGALLALEADHHRGDDSAPGGLAAVAAAVASPLCAVLCKHAAEVGATEYMRCAQVLTALSGVDPVGVGAACVTPDAPVTIFDAWLSADSALGAMVAKEPHALVAEDALLNALALAPMMVQWSTWQGMDGPSLASGMTATECFGKDLESWWLLPVDPRFKESRNMVVGPMLLELLRDPESLPTFAMPGALWAFGHCVAGRPAVAAECMRHDAIDVLVGIMRATPRHELIATASFARRGGRAQVLPDMKELVEALQLGGTDVTPQLISTGFIDLIMEAFEAVEQVGHRNVTGHHLCWGLVLLKELEGECLVEIEQKYREHKVALRYLIDHPVCHSLEQGWSTNTIGAVVAAQLFGRDEENSFGFQQADIDGYLVFLNQNMQREGVGVFWDLGPHFCRGITNLCISDVFKTMLIHNETFIPLLICGLLLDPEHPHQDKTAESVKAVVQKDFAECIQQLSLFQPGAATLQANPTVVDALDALVSRAWMEEAKDCAKGALMRLCPERAREQVFEVDPDARHVMMSCECHRQQRSLSL
jgi:hypothetical protein